jgi:hypothetical protein
MNELIFGDGTLEVVGLVILYLTAFFLLLLAALVPLFGGLAIRYTLRRIWRRFSEGKL